MADKAAKEAAGWTDDGEGARAPTPQGLAILLSTVGVKRRRMNAKIWAAEREKGRLEDKGENYQSSRGRGDGKVQGDPPNTWLNFGVGGDEQDCFQKNLHKIRRLIRQDAPAVGGQGR